MRKRVAATAVQLLCGLASAFRASASRCTVCKAVLSGRAGTLSTMEPLARKGRTPSPRRPSTREEFSQDPDNCPADMATERTQHYHAQRSSHTSWKGRREMAPSCARTQESAWRRGGRRRFARRPPLPSVRLRPPRITKRVPCLPALHGVAGGISTPRATLLFNALGPPQSVRGRWGEIPGGAGWGRAMRRRPGDQLADDAVVAQVVEACAHSSSDSGPAKLYDNQTHHMRGL